jgi:hypothetical protein
MRFQQIWLNTSHKFQKFLLKKGDALLLPYLGPPLSVIWGNVTASSLLAKLWYLSMHKKCHHVISELPLFRLLKGNFVKHHTTRPWIGPNGISYGLMNVL